MDVRYYEDERSISAELFRDSDGSVFQLIAYELTAFFNVQWKRNSMVSIKDIGISISKEFH